MRPQLVFLCFSVSFLRPALLAGPVPVLSCLTVKWVWASARKKAFGCRSRQAKRSACPTRGWKKPAPSRLPLTDTGSSLRCGEMRNFGVILLLFRTSPPKKRAESVQIRREGQGLCPLLEEGHTAAHRRSHEAFLLLQLADVPAHRVLAHTTASPMVWMPDQHGCVFRFSHRFRKL